MTDPLRKNENRVQHPRVTVVVLNWNGGEINQVCLDLLLRCEYPFLKIVFVDNGSTDGSGEAVRAAFPQIQHLFTGRNLGFTGGNNLGIQQALDSGAEMVLIMNNDVEVAPGFLEPLIECLDEGPGIAGPKVMGPNREIWCAGGMLSFHHNLSCLRGFGEADQGQFDRKEQVDYIPACCQLVSREVFAKIGLLEQAYFCYLEDVDFCVRAGKAGYPVTYCPASRVVHRFSHSTGGGYTPARKYMNGLNSVRFLKSHGTCKSWLAFWLLDVLSLPLVFLIRLFQGQARGVLAKARGILEGLAGGRVRPEALERFKKSAKK